MTGTRWRGIRGQTTMAVEAKQAVVVVARLPTSLAVPTQAFHVLVVRIRGAFVARSTSPIILRPIDMLCRSLLSLLGALMHRCLPMGRTCQDEGPSTVSFFCNLV